MSYPKAPAFAFLFWISGPRQGDHATLKPEGNTVGGGESVDVPLDDPSVTAVQAYLRDDGDGWFVYHIEPVSQQWRERQPLHDRGKLTMGQTNLMFRLLPAT
jgi:hypothetical protein